MTARPDDGTLHAMHTTHKPPPAAILVVPLIAALVLTLFAWPAARIGPRDLPVGVVGHQPVPTGAFDVHRYATEAAARDAIEAREIYGALAGAKVLVASAASPAVAQLLTHAADGRPVEDVVAAPKAGNALGASVLPLVLGGVLTGICGAVLAAGFWRRTALLVAGSVGTGLAATLIIQTWLGVVAGDWWANAAALSLTVFAVAACVNGLEALFGKAGLLAGALTMIFVGNPFSGAATSPELLPAGAGSLGQLLPPGAGGNLLRSTGYFDGAAAGGHVVVLAAWAVAGLVLLALARRPRVAALPALAR
ncbi:hypothetical protein OM076_42055 [Solirubrobacter ginsenosidimutans]|uniref:ABC transporter permease n=1 Tax=Solirubrobacter ginsenosidimutans TaxID=490573 RepID=A0A9X3S5L7_9ACTN|nr:hypothetical protein [Solirubrobacter ginsenosidimutans]MDA0166919.1 hypothetical protein [Solirubrobacter ginsenosidimutans]